MKLALSSDHAGYPLKQYLAVYLKEKGHHVIDLGVSSDGHRTDYPDAAHVLGQALQNGQAERGILVCGSGVGACIAANKMTGIYAAICHDVYSAQQGVEHDNMNVLCLGARVIGAAVAETLVDAYVGAQFQSDVTRYVRRFNKVRSLEEGTPWQE